MHTIGIDIGKSFHVAAIMDEKNRVVIPSCKFTNTKAGFESFITKCKEVGAHLETSKVAVEATGHYWMNLYAFLKERNTKDIIVLNPLQSKALRNLDIRGAKTDTIDARHIAQVVALGAHSVQHPLNEDVYALRQLSRMRAEFVQKIADNKRKVVRLLDLVFPEFSSVFSHTFGVTASAFMERYTTPEEIAKLSSKRMEALITKMSRGRLDPKKIAASLKQAARDSVGIRFATDAFSFEMRLFLQQIVFLENQTAEIERAMEAYKKKLPDIEFLMSIPGVSFILAATILGEIGDVKKFPKADSLVAYAGMDTKVVQSGSFAGTKTRLSKRGSPYLRWAYSCAAFVARVQDPALKKIFEKKKEQGKPYGIALSAVVHKMLHITYAVLKQQKPYECHLQN